MTHDHRSRKILIVSHCILNQNAKLEGIARWPGMVRPLMDVISKSGVGLIQMPCPEMLYEGARRFDKSVEQYRCAAFVRLCDEIATEIVDQMEDYIRNGYKANAILAIDGSPSCGYNLTQSAPKWRGLLTDQLEKVRYVKGKGVLMEILERKLKERSIEIPFLGVPELSELGSMEATVDKLQALVG